MATEDNRTTGYAIKVYPDTTDMRAFRSYLSGLHMDCAISPLHDSDTYDENSVIKYEKHRQDGTLDPDEPRPVVGQHVEEHYHVHFNFGRVKKSVKFMQDMLRPFFGELVDHMWFEPVRNNGSYTRYLCHLTKECRETGKPLYNVNDCQAFGDYDLSPLYSATVADQESAKKLVFEWIAEYRIYNWPDLVDIAYAIGDPLIVKTVTTGQNAALYQRYIDGNMARDNGTLPRSMAPDLIVSAIRKGLRPIFGTGSDSMAEDGEVA